ncbi:MAK10-like protein [Tanacetum coccineum]
MGDENPIRTLGDYSKPSHEGYRNTIELPKGNNVVPLRSDTIRLVQNGCSFHGLWSEDPNQHLKDFLKLVDSLDLDVANRERTRLRRTAKLRNDILMFQQHQGESLSEAWTRFKDLLQKVPHHGINLWLQVQIFYDHVNHVIRRTINQSAGGKIHDKNAEESWAVLEDLTLYDNETVPTTLSTAWKIPSKLLLIMHPRIPTKREEINDRMTDMFGLLKELTTSRAPKRELIKEEARYPITKNINSISLIRGEEEKNANDNATPNDSIERLDGSDAEVTLNEVKKENKAENGTKNEPIKSFKRELTQVKEEESVEAPSSQPVGGPVYEAILKKTITKKEDIGGNFEIPCNIGGIAKDVLVDVAGYVYPVDFVILDIKEDEKRPFILGTPFLTTAKAVIKFDKGTITLRSGKSKMSFHRIPESLCKIERGIKNDIEPIAPTMTVIFDEKKLGSS